MTVIVPEQVLIAYYNFHGTLYSNHCLQLAVIMLDEVILRVIELIQLFSHLAILQYNTNIKLFVVRF